MSENIIDSSTSRHHKRPGVPANITWNRHLTRVQRLFTCVWEEMWISKYNLSWDAVLPIARLFGNNLLIGTKCVTVICLLCGLVWGSFCFHTCIRTQHTSKCFWTVHFQGLIHVIIAPLYMVLFKIIWTEKIAIDISEVLSFAFKWVFWTDYV